MARVLLLSDIHSNLAALQAVLADVARRGGHDATWVAGDIVGYGPNPDECIAALAELDSTAVAGNHDLAAIGKIPLADFNEHARSAAEWTADRITSASHDYLSSLPQVVEPDGFTMVHGSPRAPVWEYMADPAPARENLDRFRTAGCVFGHTHLPAVFDFGDDGEPEWRRPADGETVTLTGTKYFVNPGSVGQPRDRDPRAAYALLSLDEKTVGFHRVEYDIAATQKAMRAGGLPEFLADRLEHGF